MKHLTSTAANTQDSNTHTPPMTSGIIVAGGEKNNTKLKFERKSQS